MPGGRLRALAGFVTRLLPLRRVPLAALADWLWQGRRKLRRRGAHLGGTRRAGERADVLGVDTGNSPQRLALVGAEQQHQICPTSGIR